MKKRNVFTRHPAYRWHDAHGLQERRPETNTNAYANADNRQSDLQG